MPRDFIFAIDRGGTFTDVYCEGPRGVRVTKLLSVDPANYSDAPTEGIRRLLESETGESYPRGTPVRTDRIKEIRMGTTVATNALLERQGERTALIVTKGFHDLLLIGNQARPRIFDLEIARPELVYDTVIEADERVLLSDDGTGLEGVTGEKVLIEQKLEETSLREKLQAARRDGIEAAAVVLLHSYTFRDHERRVGEICRELGFKQVSLSSEVMPMVKAVPRGQTASVDAYLTPVLLRYIVGFKSGFTDIDSVRVSFMRSDGGLASIDSFTGHCSIMSGPAGGVVGFSAYHKAGEQALIGFDMGGTSTDVSRFAGSLEHVFETTTAGVTIQSPMLDINTVAAGGGSRLFFRNGLFVVGPESAGAHPGPVCYRKGGHLAVTDANLLLGRVLPHHFPKIFGPNEDQPLDVDAVRVAFAALTEEVNAYHDREGTPRKTPEEVALGFLRVANEAMCRPIRNLTTTKGYDTGSHTLVTFGGAGPQHCCSMAKELGIGKIIVPRHSGILSAYGLARADVVAEVQRPRAAMLDEAAASRELDILEAEAKAQLQGHGIQDVRAERFLNLRYLGTDTALMTAVDSSEGGGFKDAFLRRYRREFGFTLDRDVWVDDARVRATGSSGAAAPEQIPTAPAAERPKPLEHTEVVFESGKHRSEVHLAGSLQAGHSVEGPAIIIQQVATVVLDPGCTAIVTPSGDIEVLVADAGSSGPKADTAVDPIWLSIFAHRFMGIAEQMGRTLQRTSISVNIKERLDFSCALFDPRGGLVANAPHLPVHLGAMQEAVRYQLRHWGNDLSPGDVLVSNHPQLAGGSHLPDITVITPVFHAGSPAFFVASRGHHADIGGIAPGSMPPHSKTLVDEGAAIVAFKLVERGVFKEEGIKELLARPGKLEGNSGARKVEDNISDLQAQVAANAKGEQLLWDLIKEIGLEVVQAYMQHIQANAETAVRAMLRQFSLRQGLPEVGTVRAQDSLDDGSQIHLAVTIDRRDGSAVFDFEGTGAELYGNLNAPPAVATSAVIYCLRCLVADSDLPLNQGCLAPVTISIPKGCFLSPSAEAAVVGGNVETSQRVTDVVLRAFSACAASSGTMNNFTFGDEKTGYYETICGGAGAGPSWHGTGGVHTHMTNTRITDPEIFERVYPVILRRFSLRDGQSGGVGKYRGGEGVHREVEFRRQLTVSILSERRAIAPWGLNGGSDGARGQTILEFPTGRKISLGGKNTIVAPKGSRIHILTPGGGGYGAPEEEEGSVPSTKHQRLQLDGGSVNEYSRQQHSA